MPKEAIISTPRLNSYGARVLTEGIDLTQYQKNPVLLYMHRRGRKEDMPIGIMENVRVEGDTLYGTPKFDDDTEDERNISKKWERGTLRMLSAGLDIMEWSEDPTQPAQKPLDLVRPAGGGTAPTATLTWDKATPEQLADLRDNNREEYARLYKEYFGFAPKFN